MSLAVSAAVNFTFKLAYKITVFVFERAGEEEEVAIIGAHEICHKRTMTKVAFSR